MKVCEGNRITVDLLGNTETIKGFACLWILLFHSSVDCKLPFLTTIKSMGYGGVDIFIFLSGLGCYLSLSKNNDAACF